MDPCSAVSAYDIVNYSEAQKIERIIREYGEERWARRIARFIVDARDRAEIKTTYELVEIIKAAIPASARRRGPHPAKRTFQALRIVVNDELDAVAEGIEAGIRCLCDGAVLCVISFHSLEDRIAKHTFRRHAAQGEIEILTKKPLVPTEQEMEDNPRARSAKLRAVRRVLKAGEGE
jgi:16S rRNA (cytosine1402-N4)-methyltransferase